MLAAISLQTEVTVARTADEQTLRVSSGWPYHRELAIDAMSPEPCRDEAFSHIWAAACVFSQATQRSIGGLALRARSSIPPASGLSSSAAITVATIAALDSFFGQLIPCADLLELAYATEAVALQTGAGQMDFYGCALGGVHYLDCANQPPAPVERLAMPSPVSVLVVDTRVKRSTKDIIAAKRLRWSAGEPDMMAYVQETADRVAEIRKLLGGQDSDPWELGMLINDCQTLLRDRLRVSTELIDECVARSLARGAYGAKLTGTGLGGCLFALVPPDVEDRVVTALEGLPVTVHRGRIAESGLTVS
ncbi:hypothetical protein [Kribbella sp. NPDC023855]|uniref:mevalonate kinase family protein n=1 Tax=Kribbella sp. NPDC023855 TaxID=3154698 RepID=UPI003406BDD5